MQVVVDIREVTATATYCLRRRVLGWTEPRSRLDDDSSHVAVIDGGVVVAVISHVSWPCPDDTTTPARYLWAMAVDPARQRHGYGRRLLATVADCARVAGERLMWADARESAVPFYVACGAQLSDTPSYVDEVTGLRDRRVLFLLDDHQPTPA